MRQSDVLTPRSPTAVIVVITLLLTMELSTVSGSRSRVLMYGSSSSLASFWPREVNHAAIPLTSARHDRSGLSVCHRKAQVVNERVEVRFFHMALPP